MKILALVANVIVLGFVGYNFIKFGFPNQGSDMFFVILLFLFPVLNIYVIQTHKSEDWLSLWLKRKALEEKRKIEKLNAKEM